MGDHREHDAQRPSLGRTDQRAQLLQQHRRPVEAHAYGPPAKRRVLLGLRGEIGQRLVAADIQRAEGHRLALGLLENAAVEIRLRGDVGIGRAHHERDFGAIKPDAVRARRCQMRQVDQQAGIQVQRDAHPVPADRRSTDKPGMGLGALGPHRQALFERAQGVFRRANEDLTIVAVDQNHIQRVDDVKRIGTAPDDRNAEGPRHDRDVAGRRPLLHNDGAEALLLIIKQLRRPDRAGDEHDVIGQRAHGGLRPLAGQVEQQARGQIVEIGHPLAQIRVRDAGHARRCVVAHPLNRRLGGQAGLDGLLDPAHPAAILGEHAVGLEDVEAFADAAVLGDLDQPVQGPVHGRQRRTQALNLAHRFVCDHLAHGQLRPVQNRKPPRQPIIEGHAFDTGRQRAPGLGCRDLSLVAQFTARHQFGDHHGDGLKHLHFFIGVDARPTVLDDQDPANLAVTDQGHAQKGMERVLTRFRAIGEFGMAGRVGDGRRSGRRRDITDEPLADAQPGLMDSLRVQTDGREQLQHLAGPHDVAGADLGHHFRRDQTHDLVEPSLGQAGAGHHVPQPGQQPARLGHGRDGRDRHQAAPPKRSEPSLTASFFGQILKRPARKRCEARATRALCTAQRSAR